MAPVNIQFENPGTIPPIFVAGSFTAWQPVELDYEEVGGNHRFFKNLDVPAGVHQYKFRLGHGDWWICDDSKPTEDNGSGYINNVLKVDDIPARSAKAEPVIKPTEETARQTSADEDDHLEASNSEISPSVSAAEKSSTTSAEIEMPEGHQNGHVKVNESIVVEDEMGSKPDTELPPPTKKEEVPLTYTSTEQDLRSNDETKNETRREAKNEAKDEPWPNGKGLTTFVVVFTAVLVSVLAWTVSSQKWF